MKRPGWLLGCWGTWDQLLVLQPLCRQDSTGESGPGPGHCWQLSLVLESSIRDLASWLCATLGKPLYVSESQLLR